MEELPKTPEVQNLTASIQPTETKEHSPILPIILVIIILIFVTAGGVLAYQNMKLNKELASLKVSPTPVASATPVVTNPVASNQPNGSSLDVPSSFPGANWIKLEGAPSGYVGADIVRFRSVKDQTVFGTVNLTSGNYWRLTQTQDVSSGVATYTPEDGSVPILKSLGFTDSLQVGDYSLSVGGDAGPCGITGGLAGHANGQFRVAYYDYHTDVCGNPNMMTAPPAVHQITTLFLSNVISDQDLLSLIQQAISANK